MTVAQEPIVTEITSPNQRTCYDHPAYGQIHASRVSSSHGVTLYGSDFSHRHFVMLTVSRSQLTRTLSHDWPHPTQELIEVDLSESQWAAFVSSLNTGSGVQCTLTRVAGERVPTISTRPRDTEFKNEVRAAVTEALAEVDAAIAAVDAAGLPRGKREGILERLRKAAQHIRSNLPFVADTFDKHVETTMERAKTEVNAYAVATRAGIPPGAGHLRLRNDP